MYIHKMRHEIKKNFMWKYEGIIFFPIIIRLKAELTVDAIVVLL